MKKIHLPKSISEACGIRVVFSTISLCATLCLTAQAQSSLSFSDAQTRLHEVSDAIHAASAGLHAKQEQAKALDSLKYPELNLEAQYLKYQKTLQLPSVDIPLPLPTEIVQKKNSFSPALVATWSVYTGGKIDATRSASRANVTAAYAQVEATRQQNNMQLIQLYFGQQLAQRVHAVRESVRNGLQQHLHNAQRLQENGLITRAQFLQAQVAYDKAQRELHRASYALDSARMALSGLLRSDAPLILDSPLFILTAPLESQQDFQNQSTLNNPAVRQLQAKHEAVQQNIRIQQSQWKPQVYLFSSYRANRHRALLNQPDWAAGVGVKFTLFSNIDRNSSIRAAVQEGVQVESTLNEARNMLRIASHKAYNNLQAAQQEYHLLRSSRESAVENLRIQQLAFREGQGTTVDVVDARNMLGAAQAEEAQAAYAFIMALAQLLDAAGEIDHFASYMQQGEALAPYVP